MTSIKSRLMRVDNDFYNVTLTCAKMKIPQVKVTKQLAAQARNESSGAKIRIDLWPIKHKTEIRRIIE